MSWTRHNEQREYDELVNWDARLAREAPLFKRLFDEYDIRSLADVGAGSARLAIMFASWGIDVVAIDPSEDMLELARENAEQLASSITVAEGGFGDVTRIAGVKVDAIICTGNALPHVRSLRGLHDALRDFASALRPNGLLVLHYLNHDRLVGKHIRTMTPVFRETEGGDKFFIRLLDYTPSGDGVLFDFVTLVRDPTVRDSPHTIEGWPKTLEEDSTGGWIVRSRRSLHFAMPLSLITGELERAGFTDVRAFGNHEGKPLDLDEDESMIVVATRAGE